MVQIVVIEPHLLLRLGLSALMRSLTPADRIKHQSYEELYKSLPYSGSADLVLLGASPDEHIDMLVQAARRAHAPRWLILMSESDSLPKLWCHLSDGITAYVSTRSTAESILARIASLISVAPENDTRTSGAQTPFGTATHADVSLAGQQPGTLNAGPAPTFETREARLLGLSGRQYQVLLLIAEGHPIKAIARHLNISLATTKGHLEALYQRLGVHNRNEAVFVALSRGARLRMPVADRNSSER